MGPVAHQHEQACMTFLAADVGGTHARLGLVRASGGGHGVEVLAYQKYPCRQYPDLAAIVRAFLDKHGSQPVRRAALACAGFVIDRVVINDNLPWMVDIDALQQALGLDDLAVINDFEAVGHALRTLDVSAARALFEPAMAAARGPQIVVGPGTGLGSAVLLPGGGSARVLATEAGQISLAPRTALETDILAVFASGGRHVSVEHALSGPGLLNLYRALCTIRGMRPLHAAPEAVTVGALRDGDALARETLEIFCAMLGGFVGDLAMLYGARGGVWLAGGILPQMGDFLAGSRFVERFLDKGRMRPFLERIPVHLVEHGQLGVIGAASWYLDQASGPAATASNSAEGTDRIVRSHR